MTHEKDMPLDPIEAYLDGALIGAALVEFQRRLADEPELRDELAGQERINAGLRRVFAPPRVEMPAAASAASSGWRFPRRYLAYAAAAGIALVAVTIYQFNPPLRTPPTRFMPPVGVYQTLMNQGFKPSFVCTTDEAFASTVKEKFGQPLLVGATDGIQLLGWGYGSDYAGVTLSRDTLVLMAMVDGKETVVLMDKKSRDRKMESPPAESGVHMFRGEVGDIVLYEITPSDRPTVLPRMYDPESGGAPKV